MKRIAVVLTAMLTLSITNALAWFPNLAGNYAEPIMVDDFESYDLGSIHGQGGWEVQRNSSVIGDPGWCTVIDDGTGNKVLQLINRDLDGQIDTIYATKDLGDFAFDGIQTLVVRFRANGPNDTLMCTNDLPSGFDADGDLMLDPDGQESTNYGAQGAMVVLRADDVFRARDGSSVNPSDTGHNNYAETPEQYVQADTWYDLFMYIDSPNARTIYGLSPADVFPPDIIPNPNGGVWWWHRNASHNNTAVENLKFFIGGYPWPWLDTETVVQIDNIMLAIPEPASMSLLALGGLAVLHRRRHA